MSRIMVVDDEAVITTQLEEYLGSIGYEFAGTASSGEESVKMARHLRPDVILMDIVMPGTLDGIAASEVIKKELGIPLIFLTAYDNDEFIQRAKKVEPFAYIVKPFTKTEVKAAIEIALYKRDMERHLHKAEEEIKRARNDYLTMTNLIGDIIVKVDREGRWTFVNDAACEFWDRPREKLIGSSFNGRLHPDDLEKVMGDIEKIKSDKVAKGIVKRHKTPKGWRMVEWNGVAIFDEEGRYAGLEATGRDITERKRAEEALIRSERLKALGEMAGGVAHDFNNLLAIILGNAQLLERGLMKRYKVKEIKKRLRIIAQTAHEGGETVRRLQYFTRREISTEDFTKIDLNEIIRSAVSSTSPRWKDEAEAEGIRIKIKIDLGKLPALLGSRSELMEILTNLIFNSIEAMREGGEIRIKTEAKMNEVFLYFSDTGEGIPDSIKKKIFDPFFTTKGPKASGLGLSVSYGIIERHRGKIKVRSIEGRGATFIIALPISPEVPLKKEKPKKAEKVPSPKVLIIDDEEGVRGVLGEILQNEGYQVTLAETARKGLARFRQDNPDLVITDLGMPEMSGWELAKEIKKIDPSVPVGLVTGWRVTTTKEKIKEEGVDFVLSKPFDYAKVLREVNAVLKSKKR